MLPKAPVIIISTAAITSGLEDTSTADTDS